MTLIFNTIQIVAEDELDLQEQASSTGEMTGIITAEIEDDNGNIFDVSGMQWSRYQNRPMPILANHSHSLDSGLPPIVGYSTKLYKTAMKINGVNTPVVKVKWNWLNTAVANDWKEVAKAMPLSYSTGVEAWDGVPITNDKTKKVTGYRFAKSELFEASLVAIGSNKEAVGVENAKNDQMELLDQKISGLVDYTKQLGDLIEMRLDELVCQASAENTTDRTAQPMKVEDKAQQELEKGLRKIAEALQKINNNETPKGQQ